MGSPTPWKEDKWLPGVLNYSQMQQLVECGLIQKANGKNGRDDSALDLHLSNEAFKMKKGSIKPFGKINYSEIIRDPYYGEPLPKEDDGTFILRINCCYVFKIKESLHPAILNDSPFHGQATAKSSIGRIDVIARLIVDGMKEYEKFTPGKITTGEIFLEITPITFDVVVREGIALSQLRFCNGDFENSLIKDEKFINSVLISSLDNSIIGTLSVDVSNFEITNAISAAAYCVKENKNVPIKLWEESEYNPEEFWKVEKSTEIQGIKSITIEKNNFYILRSVERISLPEGVCIYCRAMDETLGEMRIHYAGFVHPLFGLKRKDRKGTPLIFEVREHNVDVLLTQGEILARLFFYRMSDVAQEPEPQNAGNKKSLISYGDQELKLSNIFKPWK